MSQKIWNGRQCWTYGQKTYATLKDHKENFNINSKGYLINPAKSKLGKVSKTIVYNIRKNSEKSYIAINGEIHGMSSICFKTFPKKGV